MIQRSFVITAVSLLAISSSGCGMAPVKIQEHLSAFHATEFHGHTVAEWREFLEPTEADLAWRRIPWKSCLVEGLRESRLLNKPLMLWVFIDRPVDDTRC